MSANFIWTSNNIVNKQEIYGTPPIIWETHNMTHDYILKTNSAESKQVLKSNHCMLHVSGNIFPISLATLPCILITSHRYFYLHYYNPRNVVEAPYK